MTDRKQRLAALAYEYVAMVARMSLSSEVTPIDDDSETLDHLIRRARDLRAQAETVA